MTSDDSVLVMVGAIIGSIIWGFIIYYIIQSATKSKKMERQMRVQTFLLARMAEKAGVSKEEISDIFKKTV